jgi:MYXO-CTERM domain-containing protein
MRTCTRLSTLALGLSVLPALASAAHAEEQVSRPEPEPAYSGDRPRIIKFVGDATPADQRPRSSYLVIDHTALPPPEAIEHGGAPTIFFINKNGGTYIPGNNDARTNRSSIIDQTSTIPAWNVSTSGWNQVKTCMQTLFSRWNVTITDVDPGNTPHFEIVIAGSPQDIGMQQGVGGVSPFTSNCSVIPNSVVYTFAEVYGSAYRDICETAAQEIAHSFGLDHEYLCEDPMTYLYNCGNKSFQNEDAPCGEYSARQCQCGGSTQNSVEMLDELLGLAGDVTPTPPTVSITSPGNGATVAPGFSVTVAASDSDGSISQVELRIDGTLVGTDATSPYTFTTSGTLAAGSQTLQARAIDDELLETNAQITVTVSAGPMPPDAGPGAPDAGPGAPDAGPDTTPDAGPDGPGDPDAGPGGPGAGGDDDDDDGYVSGGCSSGGGAAGGWIGGALALALAGGLVSRRRRARA